MTGHVSVRKTITADRLVRAGAWCDEPAILRDLFPDGVEVTVELAERHAFTFDWDQGVNLLFSGMEVARYVIATRPAKAAFREAVKEAASEEARREARQALKLAKARAFAEIIQAR